MIFIHPSSHPSTGYKVTKIRDPTSTNLGLLFQIMYPEIADSVKPRKRFMSSFEQKLHPANRAVQYLLVAAEPYETVGFAIPSREILSEGDGGDEEAERVWEHWDPDSKVVSSPVASWSSSLFYGLLSQRRRRT